MTRTFVLLWVVATFVLIRLAGAAVPGQDRGSVSQILGFEEVNGSMPIGWHGGPPGTVASDDATVHTGRWSVRLERTSESPNSFSALTTQLPIDFAGKQVQLRGYLRMDGVERFAGLWLREDGATGTIALNNMQEQEVRGTVDWKQYQVSLPLHPGAQQLHLGVLLAGPGKVWADDLELLVDGKPIADAPAAAQEPTTVLDRDHEFDQGSKVLLRQLTPLQIDDLATLGRVWGFLKYHHPVVTTGQRQWDYDLLRVLPRILGARSRSEANAVLARWIDSLGEMPACKPCAEKDEAGLELAPDLAWINDAHVLGSTLSGQLQRIYTSRPVTGQFYVSLAPYVGNPTFDHEPAYPDISFPDPGFQLLALFRFWNMLQYWYPYRDVSGEQWPETLREFIPRVALARGRAEYETAMIAFAAKINDTHANLWSSLSLFVLRWVSVGFPSTFDSSMGERWSPASRRVL